MEKNITIDVMRIIKAIMRKWYFVLAVAVVAGILMFVYKYDPTPHYYAEATIYSSAYGSYAQTTEGVKAVQLYADIIYSNKIAERTVSILGDNTLDAEMVHGMLYTRSSDESSILIVGASGTDPYKVVAVVNAASEAFVIEARNVTGSESIQILDESIKANEVKNNLKMLCVVAFIFGGILVCGIIALIEIFSDRIYHVEDATLNGELEIIGIIPVHKKN